MPHISQHKPTKTAKILAVGVPGSGKTGSLTSLAEAGYKLRILDFDNGVEILSNLCPTGDILVETVTETYGKAVAGVRKPDGKALTQTMKLLDNFPVAWDENGTPTAFENPATWGSDTIIVLDTLTRLGEYCMNHVARLAGRVGPPQLQDWGEAIRLQEGMLQILTSEQFPCHLIVFAHVKYIESAENAEIIAGVPTALGNKFPTYVGKYFNTQLYYRSQGVGPGRKRLIHTRSPDIVETKVANINVPPNYPIETGLASYFATAFGPLKKG
jgi:hypothetical protein